MSIDQTDVVDFVTIEEQSGDVLLTISDHLFWGENDSEHMYLLQEKINTYLRFIESGEIFTKFPMTKGKNIAINVVGQFPLSEEAATFFDNAGVVIRQAGFALKFRLHHAN